MRRSDLACVLLILFPPSVGRAASGKAHPSLVDPAKAKCEACHSELLKKPLVHPPAEDDCRTCHTFEKNEGKTVVSFAAEGPALCLPCHDAMGPAAEGKLAAPHAPVVDSCVNCHEPHSAAVKHFLKAPAKELCATCHPPADLAKPHKIGVAGTDCLSCHLPHGSAVKKLLAGTVQHPPFSEGSCDACHKKGLGARTRLAATGSTLCFACHSDLEERFAKGTVHTAVKRGLCTGCHSPHLSSVKKLLKPPAGDICFGCHRPIEEKVKGPGAHAAAAEGCDGCHDPHRSDNPRQLVAPLPDLCVTCHDPNPALKKKHLGADLVKVRCTMCHDPHGSKQKTLLSSGSIHPPFLEACDTCHEGSATKLVEKGGKALCTACHGDVEEKATQAKVKHMAVTDGDCIDCHTPHASPRPRLLKASSAEVCGGCHSDQVAGTGEKAHGVIDLIGCQACHTPHGGENEKLLRVADRAALCLACHGSAKRPDTGAGAVKLLGFEIPAEQAKGITALALSAGGTRDHPITGHRAVGKPTPEEIERAQTTYKGELVCTVCHDPHKSRWPKLARTDSAGKPMTACESCHAK